MPLIMLFPDNRIKGHFLFVLLSDICNMKTNNPEEKTATNFPIVKKFAWNYCLVPDNIKLVDGDFSSFWGNYFLFFQQTSKLTL